MAWRIAARSWIGGVVNCLGDVDAWFAWLDDGLAVFAGCSLLFIAANVCLLMLGDLQSHDICTWYDAVNVHDIVYVYANVAEYVYAIVCVYVDVYVFALFFYAAYDEI